MKQVKKNLPIEKKRGGFTMVELLLVVAILVVLFALAVGGLVQMKKNLRQKELDAKAEIIYAAAQNRVAELRAAGYADKFTPSDSNDIPTLTKLPSDAVVDMDQNPTFCWVDSKSRYATSLGYTLLPETALDAELWGNNWIVEYVAETGQVYGVFYSETMAVSDFQSEDYRNQMRAYSDRLKGGARIGYYGGDLTRRNATYTLQPSIEIENKEELVAKFRCVAPDLGDGLRPTLQFRVQLIDDETQQQTENLIVSAKYNSAENYYYADLLLDSLDPAYNGKMKFSQQLKFQNLTPGHNITVVLTVDADSELVDSAIVKRHTNSLFAYDSSADTGEAQIAYRRHLQNLDVNTSAVTSEITKAVLLNDLNFRKSEGSLDSSFYSFIPIINENLHAFSGKNRQGTGEVYTIRNLNLTTQRNGNDAGLFAQYTGTISDLILTNTRTSASTGYAGALIGTVKGNVTLENCRVSLAELSGTTYLSAGDVPGYVRGAYAGGLVGVVDTGASLTVTGSVSATNVTATNAGGGVAGLVRGSLIFRNSYTDCYVKANRTGGLAGAAPVGAITAENFYTVGYLTAGTMAGGIVPGLLGSGSFTNGYCAPSYTVPSSGSIYSTAASARTSRVFATVPGTLSGEDAATVWELPNTRITADELAKADMVSGQKLSGPFRANVSGGTTVYNQLAQNLGDYSYPRIGNMAHWGDWEENPNQWSLVYYEKYSDGTYGVYGSGLRLGDGAIAGDGYGILMTEAPEKSSTGKKYVLTYLNKNNQTKYLWLNGEKDYTLTDDGGNLVEIQGENNRTFYLLPISNRSVGQDAILADDISRKTESFYYKLGIAYHEPLTGTQRNEDLEYTSFWLNPYFAKTAVTSKVCPQAPETISIRTLRHLVALSNYHTPEENLENGGRTDYDDTIPAILANTGDETHTFLQERTLDWDDNVYQWGTYANREKPAALKPIGSGEWNFKSGYDGQLLEIRNLPILSDNLRVGLFGMVADTGSVSNVLLMGGRDETGAYESVGYRSRNAVISGGTTVLNQGTLVAYNEGTIYNCAVAGYQTRITGYSRSTMYVGGLVGVNRGVIDHCTADTPSVELSYNTGSNGYVGGLVGNNLESGVITASYASARIRVLECRNSSASIAGFAAENTGSISAAYAGCAMEGSGSVAVYGFAPNTAGVVTGSYYLDGGTYSYCGTLYSFNTSKNDYPSAGSPITAQGLEGKTISGTVKASQTLHHPQTETADYGYPAVIRRQDGSFAHYGNWPNHEKDLGALGVVYWEYESGGSNSGYRFRYIGTAEGQTISGSTLCTAHDDGGKVTRFGYGYFVDTTKVSGADANSVQLVADSTVWNIPQNQDTDAANALHAWLPQYDFVVYATGDGKDAANNLFLKTGTRNGSWSLTYNGNAYTYSLSPFFGNAMRLTDYTPDGGTTVTYAVEEQDLPGGENFPYEIRSVEQLQFINWNYETLTANSQLGFANNREYTHNQKYPYLRYSSGGTLTAGYNAYWDQTHDVDGTNVSDFAPIGSLIDMDLATGGSEGITDMRVAYFAGSYNGGDYVIRNINISSPSQCVGLFGITMGAKLHNIVLYSDNNSVISTNAQGTNWYCLGGLVGFAAQGKDIDAAQSSFENCTVSGYTIQDNRGGKGVGKGTGYGGANIGGLAGLTTMNINRCEVVVTIDIRLTYSVGNRNVRIGGLVGGCTGTITNCYSGGSIENHVEKNSATKLNLGGINGGTYIKANGNLTNLVGDVGSATPTFINCYTYMSMPEKDDGSNRVIAKIQATGSSGETADRPIRIKNCFYLDSGVKAEDLSTDELSPENRANVIALSYAQMSDLNSEDGMLHRLTSNGGVFTTVTVAENSEGISGKYSFNGGDTMLTGMNYPFPTVLTQTDVYGNTVHIHYGAWPKQGLYWESTSVEMDLLTGQAALQSQTGEGVPTVVSEDAEENGEDAPAPQAATTGTAAKQLEATKTFRLYRIGGNQLPDANDLHFDFLTEDGSAEFSDASRPITKAEKAEAGFLAENGRYYMDVTLTAVRPGTMTIRAATGQQHTQGAEDTEYADLIVTVTADLKISLSEKNLTVYEGDTAETTVTLLNKNNQPVTDIPDDQLTWTLPQNSEAGTWSKKGQNGVYTVTLTGGTAGTGKIALDGIIMVSFKPDEQTKTPAQASVRVNATVYPSVVLGLGAGTDYGLKTGEETYSLQDYNQISVKHTPVEKNLEGETPTENGVQPLVLKDKALYLYTNVPEDTPENYAPLERFEIAKVNLTVDGQENELRIWNPTDTQAADGEEIQTQAATDSVVNSLQPGENCYLNESYAVVVGVCQQEKNGSYRVLRVTDLSGGEIKQQWTLELVLTLRDAQGAAMPGTYTLRYARPNTVSFLAPGDGRNVLLTRRIAQGSGFTPDEIKEINAKLWNMLGETQKPGPGQYWRWSIDAEEILGNLDVTPVQTPITYTIAFNGNFADSTDYTTPASRTATYGTELSELTETMQRQGYELTGWYADEEGTQPVTVTEGKLMKKVGEDSVELVPQNPDETITLYAQWRPQHYTVQVLDWAGTKHQSIEFAYGQQPETTLELTTPVGWDGYSFVGWEYGENLLTPDQDGKASWPYESYVPSADNETVTLQEKWVGKTLKLRLKSYRATDGPKEMEISVTYPEELPEYPFKLNSTDNRKLDGWEYGENLVHTVAELWKYLPDAVKNDSEAVIELTPNLVATTAQNQADEDSMLPIDNPEEEEGELSTETDKATGEKDSEGDAIGKNDSEEDITGENKPEGELTGGDVPEEDTAGGNESEEDTSGEDEPEGNTPGEDEEGNTAGEQTEKGIDPVPVDIQSPEPAPEPSSGASEEVSTGEEDSETYEE